MFTNTMHRSCVALLCGLCLFATHRTVEAKDDIPAAVAKLQSATEERAKTILRLAHPLGKYQDIDFADYQQRAGTHRMMCVIDWAGKEKGKPKDFVTKLMFEFTLDSDGDVARLTLTVADDTSPSKPFRASGLTVKIARNLIIKQLRKIGVPEDEIAKLKKVDALGLTAAWLKHSSR